MHFSLAAGKGCSEVSIGRDGWFKHFAGPDVEAFPAPRWHKLRVVRRQLSRNLHNWMSPRLISTKRWLAPPRSAFSLHRRMWLFAVWVAVFVMGCAVRSGDVVSYHSFNYPVPLKNAPEPIPGTLMIYRFLLDPAVNTDYLVVSQDKGKEESVPYHRWNENPADMITDLIERDLARSGLFERTVGQFSTVRYRYALEGKILELRGVTGDGKPRAVVEVETTLIDFGAPLGAQKNLMQRHYRIEIPCKDSSPSEIVEGLNRAVREVSARLRDDLRSTLAQKISSKPQQV